jgi:hypothetical protein
MVKETPARKTPQILRPKLDPYWVGWLGMQFANRPDLNPAEISELAQKEAERSNPPPSPPARATAYKYRDLYETIPEHIREGYRQFVWPDMMEDGSLPWKASRDALDLLNWADEHDLSPPTVAITAWFWRVTLALPDAPLGLRLRIAVTIATHKEAGQPIPEDLKKWIAARSVPQDYQFRVQPGGASAAWAVEVGVLNRTARAALFEEE